MANKIIGLKQEIFHGIRFFRELTTSVNFMNIRQNIPIIFFLSSTSAIKNS